MNVTVLGANGRVGSAVVGMLVEGDHAVIACVRDATRAPAALNDRVRVVVADMLDAASLGPAFEGADAIISAVGGTGLEAPGTVLEEGMRTIVDVARACGVPRILSVAAAGILDAPGGGLRSASPDYPPVFRLISKQHEEVWRILRESTLAWTIVCPPYMPSGERTGIYRVEANRLPDGGRQITTGDVADLLVREMEAGAFVGARVGVAY
jgi:putative NADH-flavin reductase